MLTAAAVCPHPPLLAPAIANGAASELDTLRAQCRVAVDALAPYDVLYVVGGDGRPVATSLAPWGVDVEVDVPEALPLSLLVGALLTPGVVRSFVVAGNDLDADDAAELGAELAASADRVAFLVMGDGSARHDVKAPGYLDERAAGFDEGVARAFGTADWAHVLRLEPALCDELLVAGRIAWQTLAGAARALPPPTQVTAAYAAPYGVGYHVAAWRWQ